MVRTVVSWLSRCVGVFVLLTLAATPVLAGTPDSSGALDAPSVPGQFLIKFRPGTPAAERHALVRTHGGAFFHHIERLDIDSAEFPALKTASPRAVATLLETLRRHPAVEFAEPNYVHHLLFTPNDPYANPSQQGSTDYQWNLQKTQAYAAWDATQGSSAIVIAIVDTGIQLDHPDLAAKMLAGYDFIAPGTPPSNDTVGENHGTRVAGVAAAVTHNGTGVAGMCPQCRILPVRVFDSNGYATSTSITDGIRWAADQGARVFNLSFAGPYSSTIESAVNYAWSKGAFLSCAAGNDNTSTPTYPAALSNCFAVAASKSDDTRLIWQQYGSSYGTWVHVAAPGDWLRTTDVGSGYTNQSWTSIAAPNVAGLAGLLSAQGLTHQQIKERICGTSDVTATTGTEWKCGRINAQRAVSPSGNGLRGEYFSDSSLSPQNLKVTRTDATVSFDWGSGSPDPSLGDVFSARWTGQVLTTGTGGSYTFYTVADDGVRLWLNGQLVIDRWFYRTPLEDGATVTLNANQRYDIKMEFYDAGGLSQARLLWQPPGGTKGAIPQSQLFPATSTVGTGLKGQYYADQYLSSLKVTRTDATVSFDWGSGSPDPSLGDVFSARWTGQVLTTGTGGSYTFYTVADDGVRLWLNGQLVIDRWFYRTPLEDGATVTLNANQRYDIKMEFYDAGGLSQARLLWQPPGGTKGAIPQSQLFPAP